MSVSNGLVTLADMLAFLPNSTNATTTTLEQAIEAASMAICNYGGHFRPFYPIRQSRKYDVPRERELDLDADLLECFSITNGDSQTLPSTEYRMDPVNTYPKNRVIINQLSSVYWMLSITTANEVAITVDGLWGMHQYYSQAWAAASTLSGAINSSVTALSVTSSTLYSAGQIVRCNDELMLVDTVTTGQIVVTRAWNGSTAIAHDALTPVLVWKTQSDIARACMIQTSRYYKRNESVFGTTGGGELGVQPIVIPSLDPDVERIMIAFTPRF